MKKTVQTTPSEAADPNLPNPFRGQMARMRMAVVRHVWRDTRRCFRGVRFRDGLGGPIRLSGEMSTMDSEGLTEIPLPSPKHLNHGHDECPEFKRRPSVG